LSRTPYPPLEPRQILARFPAIRAGEDVVAVSRSMTPALVLQAYRLGIFPWPVRQGLVPWASPDPRAVFPLERKQPWPRTVKRSFRPAFRVSFDEAFGQVMRTCGEREGEGTWITPDILATYDELHELGWAHSVEVWQEARLVGGIYGIAMGALFAGESMFHRETGASKVAFASCADRLRERGFEIFDVQVLTSHLEMLGCVKIPRQEYLRRVAAAIEKPARFD
jgi:leucyl/phenylalanyl-tRNA--protein transferase